MSNNAKEIAAIMATYEAGQEWEYRDKSSAKWNSCFVHPHTEPSWNWELRDYRRKPTPKTRTRPMTWAELPKVGTTCVGGGIETLLLSIDRQKSLCLVGDLWVDLRVLSTNYHYIYPTTGVFLPFTITETIYE